MLNFGHARPRHAPRQRRPARAPRTRLRPKWRCALYTALRELGRDQSVEMRSVRSYSLLSRDQSGYALSTALAVNAQNGARKAKVGRRNGLFRVRKKSKPRGRASVVLRTHKSILRVAVVSSLISLKKSALLGIHGANSGAVSDVDVNATAAVSATCDGVACQTPRLWAH
jgi:hypothetical protein